jgi:hypothetical protein
MDAWIPNDLIGIIGLKAFAKKAAAVVLEVVAVALADLLNESASLFRLSSFISATLPLYSQRSMNTNMSSAPIPSTMKITRTCKLE